MPPRAERSRCQLSPEGRRDRGRERPTRNARRLFTHRTPVTGRARFVAGLGSGPCMLSTWDLGGRSSGRSICTAWACGHGCGCSANGKGMWL
eukprot:352428-Chlamydomonas_euryale.AAC.11